MSSLRQPKSSARVERMRRWVFANRFRVATLYAIAGAVWIMASDQLLLLITLDPNRIALLQTLKGGLFLLLTTLLIGFVVYASIRLIARAQADLILRERALDAAHNGVLIADALGDNRPIIYVNPAFETITGYSRREAIGQDPRFLRFDPRSHQARERIGLALLRQRPERVEILNLRKDGKPFWNDLTIAPVRDEDGTVTHFVGIQSDITEQKLAQESLIQSQKLEAVGQLTGGVAHDFNNLLTVIIGNLELLETRTDDATSRQLLTEALETAEAGARLNDSLLSFARRRRLEPVVTDLTERVMAMRDMLRRALGETIELRLTLAEDLWPAKVDTAQLESAVLNLAFNARDAMPRGGVLAIETENALIDAAAAATEPELEPGAYVRLSLTDTGEGMTEEVRRRALEPFFTTKPVGKGTGLGLSSVYGFVKQSLGHVTIYSEPGHGATVNLYFRRFDDTDAIDHEADPTRLPRGDETILVVDDQRKVRELAGARLRSLGYRVMTAEDGVDALAVLAREPRVDLLFSDVVMPGEMSGQQLAEEARRRRPSLRVLLTSGYPENLVASRDSPRGFELLRKPYRQAELARRIRAALDAGALSDAPARRRRHTGSMSPENK